MRYNAKENWQVCLNLLKSMIYILIVYLLVLGLARVFMTAYYGGPSDLQEFGNLAKILFLGMRFDLSIVCYLYYLPLLLLCLIASFRNPQFYKYWSYFLRIWLGVLFLTIAFIHLCDFYFYSYFRDHLNIMVYGFLEDDTKALLNTFWDKYPVVWVFVGALVFIFIHQRFLRRELQHALRPLLVNKYYKYALGFVLFFALLLNWAGARGNLNLQMFPIGVMDTDITSNFFLNKMAFSPVYSLKDAVRFRLKTSAATYNLTSDMGYEGKEQEILKDFSQGKIEGSDILSYIQKSTRTNSFLEKNPPNVLFFVLESFGGGWISYNSEAFNILGDLKQDFAEDFLIPTALPDSVGTYTTITALMTNTPTVPFNITETKYWSVKFPSALAKPFSDKGYETKYIYGGSLAWRDLTSFIKAQYFEKLYGENHILEGKSRAGKTHDWGVFDEHLWDFLWADLQKTKKPQFVFALTTTNHPPFTIPQDYVPKSLEIPKSIIDTVSLDIKTIRARFAGYQYANQKLAEFLRKLKASPLGENTIVVVTGDHSFMDVSNSNVSQTLISRSVPIYMYIPKKYQQAFTAPKVASHMDIGPTLYDLSLSNVKYQALGQSWIHPQVDNFSLSMMDLWQEQDHILYGGHLYQLQDYKMQEMNDPIMQEASELRKRAFWALTDQYLKSLLKK